MITSCPRCGSSLSKSATSCADCGADFAAQTRALEGDIAPRLAGHVAEELIAALGPDVSIQGVIGQGGMGAVYSAYDSRLGRRVAVKMLLQELTAIEGARERFVREAQAAAAVSHPNIVSIYRVGLLERSDSAFIEMEFVDGSALDHATTAGRLGDADCRRLLVEVASALQHAHSRGVVHRDIKPSNIVRESSTGRFVVLDFGISEFRGAVAAQSANLTATGAYIGTPRYMSPEQAIGQRAQPASDVYALGCVAYEILTGQPVFHGDTVFELMAAHAKDPAPSVLSLRPDVDSDIAALISDCLEKDPKRRPSPNEIVDRMGGARALVVSWPPPGLRTLRQSARLFRGSFVIAAVFATITSFIAIAQPHLYDADFSEMVLAHGRGLGELIFGSTFFKTDGATDWRASVLKMGLATGVLVVLSALQLLWVAVLWWRARLIGFHSRVLWHVFLDTPIGDNSASGGGRSLRSHVLLPALARLFVSIAVVVSPWIALAVADRLDPAEPWLLLGSRSARAVVGWHVALCLALLLAHRRQLTAQSARIRHALKLSTATRFSTPPIELVAAWQERIGLSTSRRSVMNAGILVAAIGIVTIVAVSETLNTLPVPGEAWRVITVRDSSPAWRKHDELGRDAELARQQLVSRLRTEDDPPSQQLWQEFREMTEIRHPRDGAAKPSTLLSGLPRTARSNLTPILNDLARTSDTRLTRAGDARSLRGSSGPALVAARNLADAGVPSESWYGDPGRMRRLVSGEADYVDMKARTGVSAILADLTAGLLLAARASADSGRLDLARRDLSRALVLHSVLLRDPVGSFHSAKSYLHSAAIHSLALAGVLGQFAGATEDNALAATSARIARVASEVSARDRYFGALDQYDIAMRDVSGTAAIAFVEDSAISVVLREQAFFDFMGAACDNLREELLGPSAPRRLALSRMLSQLRRDGNQRVRLALAEAYLRPLSEGADWRQVGPLLSDPGQLGIRERMMSTKSWCNADNVLSWSRTGRRGITRGLEP